MHGALVARFTVMNPDVIVIGIEKQLFMLASPFASESRVLLNINTLHGHKHLQ
jgi:hypothetical protein